MSSSAPPPPAANDLHFERVPRARRRAALRLLLSGHAGEADAAVEQFLQFAAEQRTSLEELWLATREGRPMGAALLVPAAGRTGLLFVSPPAPAIGTPMQGLVRRLCAEQDPRRIHLIQAILDPWQTREAALLGAAGFTSLATLLYMQAPTRRRDGTILALGDGLDVTSWSSAKRPLFETAILDSYRETLDCPGLVGLRTIDDILAGHMASGDFTPDLWFVLTHGATPVGVMLLSLLSQRQAAELVYLGLSPGWRNRGIGRRLVEHALGITHARRASTMLLAVDDRNAPAMKLYQSMGFVTSSRKHAMVLALGAVGPASTAP